MTIFERRAIHSCVIVSSQKINSCIAQNLASHPLRTSVSPDIDDRCSRSLTSVRFGQGHETLWPANWIKDKIHPRRSPVLWRIDADHGIEVRVPEPCGDPDNEIWTAIPPRFRSESPANNGRWSITETTDLHHCGRLGNCFFRGQFKWRHSIQKHGKLIPTENSIVVYTDGGITW